MKTLLTLFTLSLCLGAFGQGVYDSCGIWRPLPNRMIFRDTTHGWDTTGLRVKIVPRLPDTTRIGGRMIVTYPKGYYEKDTMRVWLMVSGSDCCPKHVADSGVHGKMVVVIAGFKVIEREVFLREWEAGNPYPSTVYSINTNPLQWYQYLREDKRPIEGLIIWDTKSR